MLKHILAATDLVETRDPAVLAGAQIAKQHRADFHILHVPESSETENRFQVKHFKTGEEILYSADYAKTLITAIDAAYADILPPNADTHIRVSPGFPWEEIIRWSRQIKASMIVLGPHSARAQEKG
ncbi:MAG: universal stress protein [Desulfobacterales bacterium]